MKGVLVCLVLAVVGCQAVSFFDLIHEQWGSYKLLHSKSYKSETEEKFRMKIYMENSHKVAKHNQLYALGLVPYRLRVNAWADMLHHEFTQTLNGYNRTGVRLLTAASTATNEVEPATTFLPPAHVKLPEEVDWRKEGAVTPVKNQGHCGSCWSFSATGALEGQHFRQTGKLVSLSEQNLVDCSTAYGNNGCNGGLMDNAFQYVKDNHGIDTESAYPYEAEDDKCRFKKRDIGATDTGFSDVRSGSEADLMAAIATVGPVSVAIDASHESFQFYSEGVYDEPQCDPQNLDHGVLAVGYGTDEAGRDYWLVKNSWGETWGDKGYVRIARNKNNMCGVATQASFPLV